MEFQLFLIIIIIGIIYPKSFSLIFLFSLFIKDMQMPWELKKYTICAKHKCLLTVCTKTKIIDI